jgi:O-acetyl-ADP-ribose deacetylase (regulator of RNase III)
VIRVVTSALADMEVEAIVRAVRSDLAPVSAASRDVAIAAGADLEERLERLGSLPVGGAVMTPAGDLRAEFLIHAVVMSEDEPQTQFTVQKAVRNALARAADWGVASLALPPLGIGVGLTEPEDAADALVQLLANHLEEGRPPLDLVIVTSSAYERDMFAGLVAEVERNLSGPRP